jgi:hypothetical protein
MGVDCPRVPTVPYARGAILGLSPSQGYKAHVVLVPRIINVGSCIADYGVWSSSLSDSCIYV